MSGKPREDPGRPVIKHRDREKYVAIGGAAELFKSTAKEILLEGPAHTGKTRAVLEKCFAYLTQIPGLRMLWVRKTRKSLTESVLTTWEEEVLPPGHHCVHGTAKKANRGTYLFSNGSVVVLAGMDTTDAIMSSQYDIIVFFEATDGSKKDWEYLITRNRNKRVFLGYDINKVDERGEPEKVFFHQMIADCNPGPRFHWLNERAGSRAMHRIVSRHADNPFHDSDDQARLDSLTGATRRRLRDGDWCSEDGQVLECWDRDKMMTFRKNLLADPKNPHGGYIFDYVFGSMDFGFRDAQVLQVWGVHDDVMYLVAEIYKRGLSTQWWGDKLDYEIRKWKIKTIVADSSGAQLIKDLNDHIGKLGGNNGKPIIRPTEKGKGSLLAGLKQVQSRMEAGQIVICHDALEYGECTVSAENVWPTCTEQEISAYIWKKQRDGQALKDAPDDSCEDHGCDAMRYAVVWKFGKSFNPISVPEYAKGTLGQIFGHDKWLAEIKREERRKSRVAAQIRRQLRS